jgi:hypothetical protein
MIKSKTKIKHLKAQNIEIHQDIITHNTSQKHNKLSCNNNNLNNKHNQS